MTATQKEILKVADKAKAEGRNALIAVMKFFEMRSEPMPISKVAAILSAARDEQRKESKKAGAK